MSVQGVSTDDSISSLPDDVLGKVLSLLPTNQAASTSVLSKRWRNLFHLVDSLYLSDDATAGDDPRGFPDLVEKALSFFLNSNSNIKTFSLRCKHEHDTTRVDDWIHTVLQLSSSFTELHLESSAQHIIGIHSFASNTLVKLTISHGFCLACYHAFPPSYVPFPNLKTLSLILSVEFGIPWMYGHLISGCPVLEELLVRYDPCSDFGWTVFRSYVAVLNPCVKRLTFSCPFRCYVDHIHGQVFRTPGLVYLDYSSFVSRKYHVDMSSLVEARLDILKEPLFDNDDDSEDGRDDVKNVTNLVAGISNVKTLHLSFESLEVFHLYCKSMPVFHKLLTLSFESDKERGWQVVPLLLNNSPNLETLVIKGLVHQVTDRCGNACVCTARKKKKKIMKEEVCCLSTCQVKVLKVLGYGGTKRELNQMKHFLGNLKCLETVKVGVKAENRREDNNVNKNYQRITNALTKLPRASSNCQIHFF